MRASVGRATWTALGLVRTREASSVDGYPGLLVLALIDVTPDVALCDRDKCPRNAVAQWFNERLCLNHGMEVDGE